ncbi:MAG: hypothetical protein AAF333_08175 [Planctomycetota bacterium]
MSKPRAKKRPARKAPTAATSPENTPESTPPNEVKPAADGGTLFADIQQQCDALRAWHENATAQLVEREAELDRFAQTLTTQQEAQTREAQRLLDAQAQLETDRQQITQLRAELDEEWASVRDIRKAHEKLGRELDAERTRINRDAFKFSNAASKAA